MPERNHGGPNEALREREGLLRAVVETAVDAIITIDEHGTIRTVNPACERLFGYSTEEMIGSNVSKLMPQPYRGQHDSYLENYLRTGERRIIGIGREVLGERKDGTTFPLELAVSETIIGDRRIFTGIVRDVTQRKAAEQALRESERRNRATFNTPAVGICEVDLSGRFLRVNQRFCEIAGYSEAELLTRRLQDVTHPDDVDLDAEQYRSLRGGDIGSYTLEKRYIQKEGCIVWVGLSVSVVRDEQGTDQYCTVVVRDITAAKEAEGTLRETVGRLRAVLDNVVNGIITIDELGRVESMNPAAERIFGFSGSEVIGENVSMLMPEPYQSEHDQYLANYRRTGIPRIIGIGREVQGRRKSGEIFPLELAVSETRLGSRRIYTGLVRDITDRKRVDEELHSYREHLEALVEDRTAELEASHQRLRISERMASIGTLSAGLGHDMGNLLLPVRVRLESMLRHDLPEEVRQDVEVIEKSVEYLSQLARGLRLLSLDPAAATPSGEMTDLLEWWNDVASLLRNAIPREAKLEHRFPSGLPPIRMAKPALTQAMFNLVQNAGDAVRDRGERGLVKVDAEPQPGEGMVRIVVADNGAGMSPEVRDRCLEPFYTTKSRGISTGLGLSLVQGIIRQGGGRIEVRSEPDAGTAFSLSLPAGDVVEKQDVQGQPRAVVLLRDDRARRFIEEALPSLGFAADGGLMAEEDGARLLIIEPVEQSLEIARAFIAHDPRRRVVVYGRMPDGLWPDQFVSMDAKLVPTAIRKALQAAAAALNDEADNDEPDPSPLRR